jgi:malate synthase
MSPSLPQGLALSHALHGRQPEVLTPEALTFVAELHRRFEPRRQELLARRAERRRALRAGTTPGFPPDTTLTCSIAVSRSPAPSIGR